MTDYRIEWVTLSGGKSVAAEKLVCPMCRRLDLETEVDTTTDPWKAICSKGHEFSISAKPDA